MIAGYRWTLSKGGAHNSSYVRLGRRTDDDRPTAALNAALHATVVEIGFWDDDATSHPWPGEIDEWAPEAKPLPARRKTALISSGRQINRYNRVTDINSDREAAHDPSGRRWSRTASRAPRPRERLLAGGGCRDAVHEDVE